MTAQDVKKQQEGQTGEKNAKQDVPQADIENEVKSCRSSVSCKVGPSISVLKGSGSGVVIKVVDAETKVNDPADPE